AADIPAPDVDRHLIVQVSALAANHRSPGTESNIRNLAERHLRTVAAADEDAANRGRVIAEVPCVAHLYGEALASLDRGRHFFTAQRECDHLLRIACGKAIARQCISIGPDVEISPAERTLGINARRARQRRQRALNGL